MMDPHTPVSGVDMRPPRSPHSSPFYAQPCALPTPAQTESDTFGFSPTVSSTFTQPISRAATPSTLFHLSPHFTGAWTHSDFSSGMVSGDERKDDLWGMPSFSEFEANPGSPRGWNQPFSHPSSVTFDTGFSPAISAPSIAPPYNSSHRSSISSTCAPSEVYSVDGQDPPRHHLVKQEYQNGWFSDSNIEASPYQAFLRHDQPQTVAPHRLTSVSPYPRSLQSPRAEKLEPLSDDESQGGMRSFRSASVPQRLHDEALLRVQRTRKRTKRTPTSRENANYTCNHCGKLFQRRYNYTTHMETHDPTREYPNQCTYDGCDKKFVRRTDLLRHEQSVHVRSRNYQCILCDAKFARKDTLRRHTEDGCPRRLSLRKQSASPRKLPSRTPSTTAEQDQRPLGLGLRTSYSPLTPTTPLFPSHLLPGYMPASSKLIPPATRT